MEEGVERVDTVDGMVVRLRSGERDTQRLHGSGVGGGLVGDGDDTGRELAIQCGDGAALGQQAASAHGQERAPVVGDTGHHTYLLLAQSTLGGGRAPVMRGAGQAELAALVVAFETLAQIGLVQLHRAPSVGVEAGQMAADGFDEPHTHEPRGAQ